MDKIIVKGLEVYAYHGVNIEEKEDGQRFVLDITVLADLDGACSGDRLEDTVSYAKIIKLAVLVFKEEKNDLIERAAERVAQALLKEFTKIMSVTVLLKKPDAPIKADFDYVGVEITRTRENMI